MGLARWACNECWGLGATRRLGCCFTNSGARWCDPGEIVYAAWSRSTKLSGVGRNQEWTVVLLKPRRLSLWPPRRMALVPGASDCAVYLTPRDRRYMGLLQRRLSQGVRYEPTG